MLTTLFGNKLYSELRSRQVLLSSFFCFWTSMRAWERWKKMIAINPIIINIINATYWSTLKINNTLCTGNCFGMDANDIESTLSQLMTAPSQSSERWSFPRQVPLHSPLPADYWRVCGKTSSWGSTSATCWWATPWSEALQWSPPWWHTRGPGSKYSVTVLLWTGFGIQIVSLYRAGSWNKLIEFPSQSNFVVAYAGGTG